jgi:hypothetical protein
MLFHDLAWNRGSVKVTNHSIDALHLVKKFFFGNLMDLAMALCQPFLLLNLRSESKGKLGRIVLALDIYREKEEDRS